MYQTFVLRMAANDVQGAIVRVSRTIFGDDKDLQETAALLMSLAIMEGLRDIRVIGVYTKVGESPDNQTTQ